ncbi:hypothetical protein CONLIGDRAFT_289811 [Coniochaeta ligniaria NRRL 30616]|uniref:Uncharacterized protein n=1 Tax=Coniochaeta ligniaria NRRL 30616 TaxID=1408157 RepID=A0A1J7ISX1_9PEZI|nr:hypothetical protein CONLIGDRAFT_289811 [Coniochaeta ligniaria NRRL 30616]
MVLVKTRMHSAPVLAPGVGSGFNRCLISIGRSLEVLVAQLQCLLLFHISTFTKHSMIMTPRGGRAGRCGVLQRGSTQIRAGSLSMNRTYFLHYNAIAISLPVTRVNQNALHSAHLPPLHTPKHFCRTRHSKAGGRPAVEPGKLLDIYCPAQPNFPLAVCRTYYLSLCLCVIYYSFPRFWGSEHVYSLAVHAAWGTRTTRQIDY